jgi:putative transposase
MIVPGGGISLDGTRWVRCRPGFLLPARVIRILLDENITAQVQG